MLSGKNGVVASKSTTLAHFGIRSMTYMDGQMGMLTSNNAALAHMDTSKDVHRRS
jgi:hypothetical protein